MLLFCCNNRKIKTSTIWFKKLYTCVQRIWFIFSDNTFIVFYASMKWAKLNYHLCPVIMPVWVFYTACDRHYRESCNVQPPMKPCDLTTISHLLNSKTRLMTLMLKHALRDGKWCHLSMLKPYLFKSIWMYGALTHSITQKYHQRCCHVLTSMRINGALIRVPYAEKELTNVGALLEFSANVHAIRMMTSPKVGW